MKNNYGSIVCELSGVSPAKMTVVVMEKISGILKVFVHNFTWMVLSLIKKGNEPVKFLFIRICLSLEI